MVAYDWRRPPSRVVAAVPFAAERRPTATRPPTGPRSNRPEREDVVIVQRNSQHFRAKYQ